MNQTHLALKVFLQDTSNPGTYVQCMYLAVDASPLPHHPVAFVSCCHLFGAFHMTVSVLRTFTA